MNDNLTAENLQLKTFFLQQQQILNNVHARLKINSFIHYTKKGIYILVEFFMYLIFILGIIAGMVLRLDPLTISGDIDEHTSLQISVHNDKITEIMLWVKGIIILVSLGFLIAGLVFKRLRKKNVILMESFKTLDQMKTSFDEYTATWTKSIPQ